METISYFIHSSMVFAVLYLFYLLALKNTTCHQLNRFYLIFSALLAIVYPMIQFSGIEFIQPIYVLKEVRIGTGLNNENNATQQLNVLSLLKYIYASGVLVFAFLFFVKLIRAYALTRSRIKSELKGVYYLPTSDAASFSFMGGIYLDANLQEDEKHIIIAHEKVHVQQFHSMDIFFYEILGIVFWFNPLYRLAKHHLLVTHEFIADEKAVSENYMHYKQILVAKAFKVPVSVFNSFSQTNFLKRRLIMLSKNKSAKRVQLRYLLALPLGVLALSVQSFSVHPEMTTKANPKKVSFVKGGDEVEKQAEFKGGFDALSKFLSTNIKYPEEAKKQNLSGKVFVEFIVSSKGKIEKVSIKRGVHALLDNEAKRVIESMPDWNPAQAKGKNVSSSMVLPINFQL